MSRLFSSTLFSKLQTLLPGAIYGLYIVLALLLPSQTVLVQFAVNQLNLPDFIALWKELAVAVLMTLLVCDILIHIKRFGYQSRSYIQFWLAVAVSLWVLVSAKVQSVPMDILIYGLRFELWWVWLFSLTLTWYQTVKPPAVLNFLQADLDLSNWMPRIMLVGFMPVLLISLSSMLFGQESVLSSLGFATDSQDGLVTTAPLCHALDYGQDLCRLSGGFSTPNHLAGYLLLVLPVWIWSLVEAYKKNHQLQILIWGLATLLSLLGLFLTFARFAWLGLLAGLGFATCLVLIRSQKNFQLPKIPIPKVPNSILKLGLWLSLLLPILIGLVAINLPESVLKSLPPAVAKPSSTNEHYRRTMASLQIIRKDPAVLFFGYGLGVAGPGAKPEYIDPVDNPLFQKHELVAYDWGLVGEDLSIPENWFLQLLLNGGLPYLIGYLILVAWPIGYLFRLAWHNHHLKPSWPRVFLALGYFGILIGNMFLHIWENQTIALYWSLLWIWAANLTKNA